MKNSLWTIFFMIFITIFFISALAFINETSKERIAQNQQIEKYKSILYAFNMLPENIDEIELSATSTTNDLPWQEDKIFDQIKNQIKTVKLPIAKNFQTLLKDSYLPLQDSVEVYIRVNKSNEIIAYGFPLRGKGLWGTITAFGVISADLKKMVGIDFVEQVETPGLGARITEREFKYFFRNLNLSKFHHRINNESFVVMVNKKSATNIENSENSLQAITGATLTCNGVLNMINTDLQFYITVIKENEQVLRELYTLN